MHPDGTRFVASYHMPGMEYFDTLPGATALVMQSWSQVGSAEIKAFPLSAQYMTAIGTIQ